LFLHTLSKFLGHVRLPTKPGGGLTTCPGVLQITIELPIIT